MNAFQPSKEEYASSNTWKTKRRNFVSNFLQKHFPSRVILELVPYTGKTFEYDKKRSLGTSVLLVFAKKHINQCNHITFDKIY